MISQYFDHSLQNWMQLFANKELWYIALTFLYAKTAKNSEGLQQDWLPLLVGIYQCQAMSFVFLKSFGLASTSDSILYKVLEIRGIWYNHMHYHVIWGQFIADTEHEVIWRMISLQVSCLLLIISNFLIDTTPNSEFNIFHYRE